MKIPRQFVFALFALLLAIIPACDGIDEPELGSLEEVNIAYAEAVTDYSPLSYEFVNRRYLVNIYEPLVTYDSTFNFDTGLAVSWGRLDDFTWDFRLREGVIFHDGREFTADDVLYSLEIAREATDSELASLLSGIVNVNKSGDLRIQIETEKPDPLLLNKLTNVFMVPAGYEDFQTPVGTGPYYVSAYEDDTLILGRFDGYWGEAPYFETANLTYIPDLDDRFRAITDGDVHVLANVPPQFVLELEQQDILVDDFPSLEVSFLMFNMDRIFGDDDLREAVWAALGTDFADALGGGYLSAIDQYAASGIGGYVSGVEEREQDLDLARELKASVPGQINVTLDLPLGLDALGEAIAEDLAEIDINVTVNVLGVEEFEEKILAGQSEFYFFGWKFDLADVADFYESVAHSTDDEYGTFNGMSYKNPDVDQWIEEAATVLDVAPRRLLLAQIAQELLEDKVIMPLFESKVLYGIRPEVSWDIRLDGLILASEIVENMVK